MKLFRRNKHDKPIAPVPTDPCADNYSDQRERMVRNQIEARNVSNQKVLEAMRQVPRHEFVLESDKHLAYDDNPLQIGLRQTISQPYIVALMSELIDPREEDIILEIGAGSGYQSAILSLLVRHVYSIERHQELVDLSRERLVHLGYNNVTVIHADGYKGLVEHAPFDGIIVTAAPPSIPPPLISQVKPGRHLVIPVGVESQDLLKITPTTDGKPIIENITAVRFVPMIHNSD